MNKKRAEDRRIKAQRILNSIKSKHDDTNGVYFMTEALTMKSIDFTQACNILGDLKIIQHIDAGGFETHKGTHPTLGELVLVANAADGTATLIQPSITAG